MDRLIAILEKNYYKLKHIYTGNNALYEDMFHNSIEQLLTRPEKFTYKNEKSTLAYIKAFLYNDRRAQLKKKYLDKNIYIDLDTYLRETEDDNNDSYE